MKWVMRSQAGKPWGPVTVSAVSAGLDGTGGRPSVPHWMYAAATKSTSGETRCRRVLSRMCIHSTPRRLAVR
jgi:hypothetical protein